MDHIYQVFLFIYSRRGQERVIDGMFTFPPKRTLGNKLFPLIFVIPAKNNLLRYNLQAFGFPRSEWNEIIECTSSIMKKSL